MSVTTPHPAYSAMLPLWTDLKHAYLGEVAVKGAMPLRRTGSQSWTVPGMRYLPRPSGMKRPEQYETYLQGASWMPATERAVHGITGSVFRHEPALAAPPALEPQLADITQTGVPLRMFAEQLVMETLLMGRHGLLVDFPGPVPTETWQLVAPSVDARPYWVSYSTEQVINWRTVRRQSQTRLSLVVLKEYVEAVQGPWGTPDFFLIQDHVQYRVLRLDDQGRYEVSVWAEVPRGVGAQAEAAVLQAVWVPLRQGQPLDFIPFVFLAPYSLEPTIQKSLLEGLVHRNYLNFRHSADYEHARHLTAMPMLYIAADLVDGTPPPDVYVGSGTALWLPKDSRAGLVEFQGQGLQPHENVLRADQEIMAALGARLLEGPPQTQETATGVQWRLAGSDSPVQSLISVVTQGMTWALQVHAYWAGFTENVDDPAISITLNKDLVSNVMAPQMLQALMHALLNGTISYETFYFNLQRGEIARPLVPVEDEQALLELAEQQRPLVTAPRGTLAVGSNGTTRTGAS